VGQEGALEWKMGGRQFGEDLGGFRRPGLGRETSGIHSLDSLF